MIHQFTRTELLLGREAMERIARARVAVFGIGGVGGHAAEALARSGVGTIDLFDDDEVCLTNLNRQLIAAHSSLGRKKVEVMRERILDIHPDCRVTVHPMFYLPENADTVDLSAYDYVIDAVDTVSAKLELAVRCDRLGVPIISSMGAGNKLDPTAFEVSDIYRTSIDPLARVMRRELKKRGVRRLRVVWSKEPPLTPEGAQTCGALDTARKGGSRRSTPGSCAFVPSVAGLILAGEVVKALSREIHTDSCP